MTSDPVETIRMGLDAWSRGDLEGMLESLDPEIEFVTSGAFPGVEPVYRGHDGFRQFWSDFRETWQQISIEVERFAEGEPPHIAAVGHFEATGRDGISVGRPIGTTVTVRNGLITRMQSYGTWDEAFEAAGVPATERREGYR